MFQQIVIRSNVKKQEFKEQIAQLETSASSAAAACARLLVDDLNEEVKQVHDTQKLLERESQLLQQELSTLTAELTGWSHKTEELLEALKHVGDIEHYVAVLKREAAALERVLGQLPPAGLTTEPSATSGSTGQHTECTHPGVLQANPTSQEPADNSSAREAAVASTHAGSSTAHTSQVEAGTLGGQQQQPSTAPLPLSKRAFS